MNMDLFVDAIMLPLIVSTLTQLLIGDTPDKEESIPAYLWKNTYGFLLGTVPVINQLTTYINGYTPTVPISQLPASIIRAGLEVKSYAAGTQTGLKTTVDVGRAITGVAKAPGSGQIWRSLDYIDSYMQGKEGDTFNPIQMLTEGKDRDG